MHKILPFVTIALVLAACTTPQERCISGALSEQRSLSNQIRIIETNVSRGYAIHSQTVPYTYIDTCFDNANMPYSCQKNGSRVQETPVAINTVEERRKLAPLRQRLAAVQARTNASVAQCRAQFPE